MERAIAAAPVGIAWVTAAFQAARAAEIEALSVVVAVASTAVVPGPAAVVDPPALVEGAEAVVAEVVGEAVAEDSRRQNGENI